MAERADLSRVAALLMASGTGTRLWPLSNRRRPKQFTPLLHAERSMLQETFARLPSWVPKERVFVNVARGNEHWVYEQLPQVPKQNVIVQPEDRDTLPILGLATAVIERAVPGATLLLFASDNVVGDDAALERALMACVVSAQAGKNLVSMGIRPTYPSTQYGYMELGQPAPFADGAYWGLGYTEKPVEAVAKELVAGGKHDWNSGMFAWDASTFFDACAVHAKEHAASFAKLRANEFVFDGDAAARVFAEMPKISVNHGLLEHVRGQDAGGFSQVFVRGEFPWDDLGHFQALAAHLPRDAAGNAVRGDIEAAEATGSVLVVEPPYKLMVRNVKDMVVAVSAEGDVLVSALDRVAEVRALAELPLDNCLQERPSGRIAIASTDVFGNHLGTFARVRESSGCELSGDAGGVIAALGVSRVRVAVEGHVVSVSTQRVTNPPVSSSMARCPYVHVDEDAASMSQRAAEFLVHTLKALLGKKERPAIILSSGKTPKHLYQLLRTRYRDALPWARLDLYQMD